VTRALVIQGDCPCHPSAEIAAILVEQLHVLGAEVVVTHTMDCFLDAPALARTDLIVMSWHMASITHAQLAPFLAAVEAGTGLAGIHGYAGDTLRNTETFHNMHAYEWMIGGQWVSHPGDDGVTYPVRIVDRHSPITAGLADFTVRTEKYYMRPPTLTASVCRLRGPSTTAPAASFTTPSATVPRSCVSLRSCSSPARGCAGPRDRESAVVPTNRFQ
jgi:type 1 glutamine amidotransferase